jgi:hypothetical protein
MIVQKPRECASKVGTSMPHTPAVEKMIAKVQKKKELSEKDAIEYMLAVATGRLAALWRYDDTLPEGKKNKGVLVTSGRKKRAERAKAINAASKAAEPKPKREPKTKRARKPKAVQTELVEVAQ